MTERRKSWLVLALCWGLLLLLAALRPLAVPDEGRYGEIGRWMLQSGDWLTPRLNGIPFFHKPPYLYWLEALSLASFGVTPWALRLVPALHAGLMLSALYLAARRIGNERLARRAVLMLGSSLGFLIAGQYVNHDMLVAAWISVAIGCFGLAFGQSDSQTPHLMLARLGFVACAFGFLSKGLIGIALPGLVLLLWLVWTRQLNKVLYLPWFSGLALFALIALPWFVLAHQQYPDMLAYMFGKHQVGRYTATTFNNARPFWFYLPVLVLLFFPWIYWVPKQALAHIRRAQAAPESIATEYLALCWIWLLAIVAFFSLPNSKLVGYALPVLPALALLAAQGFEQGAGRKPWANKLLGGLLLLALGVAVAAQVAALRYTQSRSSQDVANTLACLASPGEPVYVLGHFPYDLPFYAQTRQPLIALQDWPALRQSAPDGWQRELFEGAVFDGAAAALLQTPDVLAAAGAQAGAWLLAPLASDEREHLPAGWHTVQVGRGWVLLRSGALPPSAPKSPEASQHPGLPGCQR